MRYYFFLILVLNLLIGGLTEAQVLRKIVSPNQEEGGHFGMAIAGIEDLNEDGCRDILIGAPGEADDSGRIYVFDGATGEPIHTIVSPIPDGENPFGCSLCGLGDVNDDGVPDFAAGSLYDDPLYGYVYDSGRVYVFSGSTGDTLYSLTSPSDTTGAFGFSISGMNDIDGDGLDEIIVGAMYEDLGMGHDDAGRAYVFSGGSGELLLSLSSPNEINNSYFGSAVSGLGDLDNDSHGDFIIGAAGDHSSTSFCGSGRAYIISGATGTILHTLASPNEQYNGWFGYSVSKAGDIDADGFDDVIVGAHGESGNGQPEYRGRAYVFSGHTGDLLLTLVPSIWGDHHNFGASVSSVGDVDYDGCDDLVVGTFMGGFNGQGRAFLFSGATGDELYLFKSPNPEFGGSFGYPVSRVGDLNNDGSGDILIGAMYEDIESGSADAGRVYVFDGFMIPVRLTIFEAKAGIDGIHIYWRTESEDACYGFHLCRMSKDSDQKQRITERIIPGGGTSAVPREYDFVDPVTQPGTYLYLLEEVGEDGRISEFGPVEITISPTSLFVVGPYPNPAKDNTEMRLQLPGELRGNVEFRLYDMNGRLMRNLSEICSSDEPSNRLSFSVADFPPGVYQLRVSAGNEHVSKSMVVVR